MIIDHYQMSKEDTWLDYLTWYGQAVGRMTEQELETDAVMYSHVDTGAIAAAELRRRAALAA